MRAAGLARLAGGAGGQAAAPVGQSGRSNRCRYVALPQEPIAAAYSVPSLAVVQAPWGEGNQ